MSFKVTLVDNVKAEPVTHAVKFRRGGIMRGSYAVYVVLFHKKKVAENLFFRHTIALAFRCVVTVDAFQLDGCAVYTQHSAFLYGNRAEAEGNFNMLAVAVDGKRVKVRGFGCPEERRIYIVRRKPFSARRDDFGTRSGAVAEKVKVDGKFAVCVGVNEYIAHVRSRSTEEINVAEYAVIAQAVLIFKICCVTIRINLDGNIVFALGDEVGYIEFRLQARAL